MRRSFRLGIGVALAGASIGAAAAFGASTRARAECTSCEDVRAATDSTDDLRLLLNVPAYRLDVIEHQRVARSISVAVGQPRYRTPLGHFQVDHAVWNPWWIPPKSDWARKERPQRPLVRLLHERAGPPLPPALLDSLVADTSRTCTIALGRTVPNDIEYWLAEARSGELVVYPDVYRLAGRTTASVEEQAIEALLRARIDTAGVAMERIRTLARASRRAAARMALDSLFISRDTAR